MTKTKGFTLLEVMIALAIISGLLITVIYTLNYHLNIAQRHETSTVALILGKNKISELEKNPSSTKGTFPAPYSDYRYEAEVKESRYPGALEISVTVTDGKEKVVLKELITTAR
jgi:general secretion pathway protein I